MKALLRKGHAAEHLPDLSNFCTFGGFLETFYTFLENLAKVYIYRHQFDNLSAVYDVPKKQEESVRNA